MQKKEVSKIMLVFIVIAIVLYTAADFLLQYLAGVEVSPTLTTCWFAFWGTEIVALAIIKTSKVKHNQDCQEDETEEFIICEEDFEGNKGE